MFTNHFRAAAILKAKGKCDSKKQKEVENTGGGMWKNPELSKRKI